MHDVEVTLCSREAYARLRASRASLDVHVKVDTGMGRWGMSPEDALRIGAELAAGGERLRLTGLMSHLASADSAGVPHAADAAFTDEQIERFRAVADQFPACTGTWETAPPPCGWPTPGGTRCAVGSRCWGCRRLRPHRRMTASPPHFDSPATWRTSSCLQPGESAGYGRRFIATEPTWIGLVPAGYADGVPRILSGQADVLVRGRRRRVAATISMDQLTFVIGPECDVELGDAVTLIGRDGSEAVTAEEWAQLAGTINYEVVTGLEPRPWRVDHVFTGG